jgi:hypothetical protein
MTLDRHDAELVQIASPATTPSSTSSESCSRSRVTFWTPKMSMPPAVTQTFLSSSDDRGGAGDQRGLAAVRDRDTERW